MRKKTQNRLFNNILWYFIYLLPLILMVCVTNGTSELISFTQLFNDLGLTIFTDNIILTCLSDLFGASGILPLFNGTDIFVYLSYFASVVIIHLAIDFILFIPRFAHNIFDKLTGGKD